MSSHFLRVKFNQNGEYFPILSEGSRNEMEILEEYLQDLFNVGHPMMGEPGSTWYEIDTLDDENDVLIYYVKENLTPKDTSIIESKIRIDFPKEEILKWNGTQHRLDTSITHNPFYGIINLVFQFEGGESEVADPVQAASLERMMKEDAVRAMEDDLKKTEAYLKNLRANIEKTKAQLGIST